MGEADLTLRGEHGLRNGIYASHANRENKNFTGFEGMKKFIRNRKTGAFLTDDCKWTTNKDQASDFMVNGVALQKLYRHELGDIEWYYWFEETSGKSDYDFTVKIGQFFGKLLP